MTQQEETDIIQKLENRKGTGEDGINNEIIKYCRPALGEVTNQINKITESFSV